MKLEEKCPICNGEIKTKFANLPDNSKVPLMQMCLSFDCNWYKEFSNESKKKDKNIIKRQTVEVLPYIKNTYVEDKKIHENNVSDTISSVLEKKSKKPEKKTVLYIGIFVLFLIIAIFIYNSGWFFQKSKPQPIVLTDTPIITETSTPIQKPNPTISPIYIPNTYPIKMTLVGGLYPSEINIKRLDTVIWNNEENQRTRVVLISKDGLFDNQVMEYAKKFSYQFNESGDYTFVLAEHPSLNEYPNTTGKIKVN